MAIAETQREKSSLTVVNLGLAANIFLAVIKTAIGIVGHSPALLADGVNSTSDVAYSLVVSIFIRLSRKPADAEHPFGHSQFESIAALTVGSFVITSAMAIFWDAVNTVYNQLTSETAAPAASPVAFWVALFTVGLKMILFTHARWVGKSVSSTAVMALAYDHRNDIFSASAALAGITMGRSGYTWVDPLAGAIVALVVLRTGIQILRESAAELMDTVPGQRLNQQVMEILTEISEIKQVEDIHAHRFGPYLVMNITIGIDGSVSVREGDRIATLAEQKLRAAIEFLQAVHIHYHPAH